MWQIEEDRIDWFMLEEGTYRPLSPDGEGLLRSPTVPGLVLDVEALRRGDLSAVLAAVQAATGAERHQAFVDRLAAG